MDQIAEKPVERVPPFQPRVRKSLFILFLCLPLAILASPSSAAVGPDISLGYAASRAPNQIAGGLQVAPTQYLLFLFFKRISDAFDEEISAALKESEGNAEYARFQEHHRFQIPKGSGPLWENKFQTGHFRLAGKFRGFAGIHERAF